VSEDKIQWKDHVPSSTTTSMSFARTFWRVQSRAGKIIGPTMPVPKTWPANDCAAVTTHERGKESSLRILTAWACAQWATVERSVGINQSVLVREFKRTRRDNLETKQLSGCCRCDQGPASGGEVTETIEAPGGAAGEISPRTQYLADCGRACRYMVVCCSTSRMTERRMKSRKSSEKTRWRIAPTHSRSTKVELRARGCDKFLASWRK
jgi:hypothetical protein